MKLVKKSLQLLIYKAMQSCLLIVILLINVKFLSINDFAIYAIANSIIVIAVAFAKFGITLFVLRNISYHAKLKNHQEIIDIINQSTKLTIIQGMIIDFLMYALWLIFKNYKPEIVVYSNIFYLGLIIVPFYALSDLRSAVIRGLGWTVSSQLPEIILRPILLLTIGLLFIEKGIFSLNNCILTILITIIIEFFVGVIFIKYILGKNIKKESDKKLIGIVYILSNSKHFSASSIFGVLKTNADILISSIFLGLADLAILKICNQLTSLYQLIFITINNVNMTRVGGLNVFDDYKLVKKITQNVVIQSIIISFPLFILMIIFGSDILKYVLGYDGLFSYKILISIAIVQVLTGVTICIISSLNMSGWESFVSKFSIYQFFIGIFILSFSARIEGLTGVAYSSIAISSAGVLILVFFLETRKKIILRKSIYNQ